MSFEWELSKENVRPLKQGRNVDTLNAALGQQKPTLQRSLEAQKAEYEKQLSDEAGESDDPVALYQNYVSWVEQSYPSGNRKPLIDALERSLRALKERTTDIRCLKLWLKYIDLMGDCSKQITLFTHLQSSDYFQDHALFYEAWAALLESMQQPKEAENIYQKGRDRKAQPLSRLERHHKEFEQRVMAGIVLDVKRPVADSSARAARDQPRRHALSDLGAKPGVMRSGAAIQGSAGTIASKGATSSSNARPVVLDENSRPAASTRQPTSSQHGTVAPSHAAATKENVKSAGQWVENKHPAQPSVNFSDLKRSSVRVLGDPDAAQSVQPCGIGPNTTSVVPAAVLRPHKATAADAAQGLASISKPQPPREHPMYPKADVYSEFGTFSMEELRARCEYQRYAAEQMEDSDPDAMELTRVMGQPIQYGIDQETITRLTAKREFTISRRLTFEGLEPELNRISANACPTRHFDWGAPGGVQEVVVSEPSNFQAPNPPLVNCRSATITPSPANSTSSFCTDTPPIPTGMVGHGAGLALNRSNVVPHQAQAALHPQFMTDASFGGRSSSMTCLGPAVTPTMTYHTRYATERLMSAMKSDDADNASLLMASQKPYRSVAPLTQASLPAPAALPAAVVISNAPPAESGFTVFDETAPASGIQIFDENAAQAVNVDKENSGRVPKPRQNTGLRGLIPRDPVPMPESTAVAPQSAPVENNEPSPQPSHSTPGPMSHHTAMDMAPAVSTIRHANRPNAVCLAENQTFADPANTWVGNVRNLTPIEEESSRSTSLLSRTTSSSSSSSRSGMCSTLSASHPNVIPEEQHDEPMVIPSDGSPSTGNNAVVDGVFTRDPFSPTHRARWMAKVGANCSNCPGYVDLSQKPMPEVSQKFLGKAVILDEDDQRSVFVLKGVLGSGAFSTVFSANHVADTYDVNKENIVALKVSCSDQPDLLEFFVTSHLPKRIEAAGHSGSLGYFVGVSQCFHFSNGTCMVLNKCKCTLLDIVNQYKNRQQTVPEALVLYYTWHMLRILESLHAADYLHGDIKPDNFMVTDALHNVATYLQSSDSTYLRNNLPEVMKHIQPIQLIDFGRAIDLSCLPKGTAFSSARSTEGFSCVEMLEDRPWSHQIDTFGLLGTIHVLLFGSYMKVARNSSGVWQSTCPPKRYWSPVWNKLYSQFLNVPSCQEQPNLTVLREAVGAVLISNCDKLYTAFRQQHDLLTTV